MRFLLVEDNANLAAAVLDRLRLDGHVVDHASDVEAADSYVATTDYDLILLDIMLPDGDGRSFLRCQPGVFQPFAVAAHHSAPWIAR